MSRRPTALGAHIYAGGFTLGVAPHFQVLGHLEEWRFGTETAKLNLGVRVDFPRAAWPLAEYRGRVDFVYCNPPCAPFSQLKGKSGGNWQVDPRLQYWVDCLGLLESLAPKVWACESVRGIYARGRSFTEPYVVKAAKLGYKATHVLVNGREHGVPQFRPRYFLVLSKVGLDWRPTGLRREATIADAWKRGFRTKTLAEAKPKLLRIIRKAEAGEDLRRTFNRTVPPDRQKANALGGVAGRPPFALKRLREEGLAHVITGGCSFVHPTEHRFLTVEEQAALCGYPRNFRFVGTPAQCYPQIGKAVMPPVAEYLARTVAAGLRRGRRPKTVAPEEVTVLRDKVERRDVDPYSGPADLWKPPPPPDPKAKGVRLPRHGIKVGAIARQPRRGSGYRIRCMLKEGRMTTEQILAVIHREFPESTAKASDVYWNKRKLAAQGGVP